MLQFHGYTRPADHNPPSIHYWDPVNGETLWGTTFSPSFFSSTEAITNFAYRIYAYGTSSYTGDWHTDLTTLAPGNYRVETQFADLAGNPNTYASNFTIAGFLNTSLTQ